MCPKSTSKQQAPDSICAGIRKEFAAYFNGLSRRIRDLTIRYPRPLGTGMLCSIGISAVLCFTVMRKPGPVSPQMVYPANTLVSDAGSFYTTISAIDQLHTLYNQLDILSKQQSFNQTDSLQLLQTLQQIKGLQKQFRNSQILHQQHH
jgi:hypothetical protein